MKHLCFIGISILFANGFGGPLPAANPQGGENVLEAREFQSRLHSEKGVLLDVRTPAEYQRGHLNDARNLDFFGTAFQSELEKLPKDKTYFIYCASGGRSGKTLKMMAEMGFSRVFDLRGGFNQWQQLELPTTVDP